MSKSHHTTHEDGALSYDEQMENAGMIWEADLKHRQHRREMHYFYAGCMFTCGVIGLVVLFVVKFTGLGDCA